MNSKKITKIISVIMAIAMIASFILITINMKKDVNQSAVGIIENEDNASKYYDGYLMNKKNVRAIDRNYEIPDITGDDIIAEACKFYRIKTWKLGVTRYTDAWDGSIGIAEKTKESGWKDEPEYTEYGDSTSALDCSGFVYSTLRHLGVRLTNFYDGTFGDVLDGRGGPVPLNAMSWVHPENSITYNKGTTEEFTEYPGKPYEIKWENDKPIYKITGYTCETYEKQNIRIW